MKGLVLLYRAKSDSAVTIKEFPKIEDQREHYIVGENWLHNREGIMKKYVGRICKIDFYCDGQCDGKNVARYPIELPDMREIRWNNGGYFMFVNKTKYDENPTYWYDIIKNYREPCAF